MSSNPHIVYLPGMGADERLYKGIAVPNCTNTYLNWIPPEANESLRAYALRLIRPIQSERVVLVGSSFGGVLALEIANVRKVERVVLIGAPKEFSGFSFLARSALNLGKFFGKFSSIAPPMLVAHVLQVKQKENRALFVDMLQHVSPEIIPFALKRMGEWKPNQQMPITQIIGEKDWIVSRNSDPNTFVLSAGGHCLTFDNPAKINQILQEVIELL